MPTTDLVSGGNGFAGGGVGDGQRVSVMGSITSGASPVFTPVTDIFAANGGDPTGKTIYLVTTGWTYPTSLTAVTIASYNSGTGAVTLSGTNATAKTSVTMDVLWGTNNTSTLLAFQTWAQAQVGQVILTIPAGRFCTNTNGFVRPNEGIPDLKWVGAGAGATIISQLVASEMRLGADLVVKQKGMEDAAGNSLKIQTVSAGAATATLVDSATYGARASAGVGRYCLVAGYDMQSTGSGLFGYPPNQYYYEYNKIIGYSGGVITFQNSLTQAYKSTWPQWSIGGSSACDQGGCATIWICDSGFDATVELNDMTIDNPYHQNSIHCRDVILRRVTHIGPGTYPTQCNNFTADTSVWTETLEIDKLVNNVAFANCALAILQSQSASPNVLAVTGGTLEQVSGTPKRFTFSGVSFTSTAKLQVGTSAYGFTSYGSVDTCTGIASFPRGVASSNDVGTASAFYSFNAGVMRFLKSTNDGSSGKQNPTRLLVPGAWVTFDDKYIDQVTDVYEDGTYCYIQWRNTTDWPFTPVSVLRGHPCPDFTMRNCTGTASELEDWNQAPARIPLMSYIKRSYLATASASSSPFPVPFVIGKPTSIKLTPTSLYTGTSLGFLLTRFSNMSYLKQSDYSTVSNFATTINMKVAGERVLANATAGTGAQSGDTLYDFTSAGNVWFFGNVNSGPIFSANVVNGETPTITVEWIMDQGIPSPVPAAVVPLRLRLRA